MGLLKSNKGAEPPRSPGEGGSLTKVVGVPAGGRAPLALVLGLEAVRAVGMIGRRGHLEERDLPDLHARVHGDGEVGHVGQFEGEVTVPAGVERLTYGSV